MEVTFVCSDNASVNVPFEAACAYFGLVRDLARDTTDFAVNPEVHVPATGREMNIMLEGCRAARIEQNELAVFLQCSELDWPDFAQRVAADCGRVKPEHPWFTEAIRRKMLRTAIKCHMDLEFIVALDCDDADVAECVAAHGTLEAFRYFMGRAAFPWDDVFSAAVRHNNLACIKEMHCEDDGSVSWEIATSGSVEAMKYIIELGEHVTAAYCGYAAEGGNLAMLKYLRERFGIDRMAVKGAFDGGNLECLQYAIDEARAAGVPLNGIQFGNVLSVRSLEMLEANGIDLPGIEWASSTGNIEAVKFLLARGKILTFMAPNYASSGGHLECLKFLHEQKCPWRSRVTEAACEYGYLDILTYAIENRCPCNVDAAIAAVKFGRLDCLRYLLEARHMRGGRVVVKTAIEYNRADCLALLKAHGFE